MAPQAESTALRQLFPAAGGGGGDGASQGGAAAAAAAPVFLATETEHLDHRPVDPVIWGDEERMKRELLAWAKAVASMAAASKRPASSSDEPRRRRRRRPRE